MAFADTLLQLVAEAEAEAEEEEEADAQTVLL
jgi:hypothetical protein